MRGAVWFAVILLIALSNGIVETQTLAQLPTFPGAEGYGKYCVGGRGGSVYEVTTLNPTGPGSLGEAIAASGPRTVVFRVSGTIDGNFDIGNPNITIAGQTAPGDGITVKGSLGIGADDVNIRYIRVRAEGTGDALGGGITTTSWSIMFQPAGAGTRCSPSTTART